MVRSGLWLRSAPWVYDPVDTEGSPVLDENGNPKLGILSRLGISFYALMHTIACLQRICEICRTTHTERKECGQDGLITRTTRGRGNRIGQDGKQMRSLPSAYRLNVRPLSTEKQESLFRAKPHGRTTHPLLDTSSRSHTSKLQPSPSSPSTTRDSSGGEHGGGSLCSNFLMS